jgi:nucleoside-diphosphate-sugar epimerase
MNEQPIDPTGRMVLLTGGAGYIGSVLAGQLVEAGFKVRILDKLFFGNPFTSQPQISVIQKDTRDVTKEDLLGVTDVIDLAAISNDPAGDLIKDLTLDINFTARKSLQELCVSVGVQRYILASSCSVYGFQDEVVDESSPINPLTTYAEANAMSEQSAISLVGSGTVFTAIRQATVYGASRRMRYDLVVNAMALNVIQGNPLKVLRDGMQWRPLVHVADTSKAMLRILQSDASLIDGQIFNVGSDEQNLTVLEIAELVSTALGKTVNIEWYGDPDHRSYKVSFEKIRKTIDFLPQMNIPEAALEIAAGFRSGPLAPKPQNYTLAWYQTLLADGQLR